MRNLIILGVVIFACLTGSESSLLAFEPDTYQLSGIVKNSTPDGVSPAGLSVALHT